MKDNTVNHFVLFAFGEKFDVDDFVNGTTLKFEYVWHFGDRLRYSCSEEDRYNNSGVEKLLGSGTSLSLFEQQRVAETFLLDHHAEMQRLASFQGITTFVLGLQYVLDSVSGVYELAVGANLSLMKICASLNIEIVFYITITNRDEN